MKLFDCQTYVSRRNELKKRVGSGQILLLGNIESPYNYTDNTYRFRQDSSFLYYFGINLPGLMALIDIDANKEIIFGNEYSLDDIIWIGKQDSLINLCEKVGISDLKSPNEITKYINKKQTLYLPPYRYENKIKLSEILGIGLNELMPSEKLIRAIISMRSIKSADEIEQMTEAVNISRNMHLAAMKHTKSGKMEYEIVAKIMESLHRQNAELAYPVILSTHGQTLHNHFHGNKLVDGRLVLNDAGAENTMCYAGDITRTFPVSGKFSTHQAEIYATVLEMEKASINAMKPGVLYRDIHLAANKLLLENFVSLGILNGDINEMLAEGVAGMFMPHGLGHMIGLDVHDMEDLGENYIGYRDGLSRSSQLGLKSLRYAKELEIGNVLTVEPGCYFIPELINKYKSEGKFKEYVNYSALAEYHNFGGVRIEDNVLVTETGLKILGEYIPKEIHEIENLVGSLA